MKHRRIEILSGVLAVLCLLVCACSSTEQEQTPETDAELAGLLEQISTDYHPGTAGSSLTGASLAGRLLDWYADSGADADTIGATVQAYCEEMDDVQKTAFENRVAALSELSSRLLEEDAQELLETAGYEADSFPWSAEAQQTLFGALCEGCGQQLPGAETDAAAA